MQLLFRYTLNLALCALLWVVVSGGHADSWLVGVPSVLMAAGVMLWLRTSEPARVSPWAALQFLPYFLLTAFRGGIDVARRAMHPERPIHPGMLDYPLRLEQNTARVFFMNSVSLLPGTLSADLRGATLLVHVIDTGQPNLAELEHLETRVARLFRQSLDVHPAAEVES